MILSTLIVALTTSALPSLQESLVVVRTDSPRATLESFMRLRDAGEEAVLEYWELQDRASYERVLGVVPSFEELMDLTSVPNARRQAVASDTIDVLLDVLGRVELPPLAAVPGLEDVEGVELPDRWRVPRTPLWIVRVSDGPRAGEFLFGERTVAVAPGFFERVRHLPLRSSLEIASWSDAMAQLHGPSIPSGVVRRLPEELQHEVLDTPIWKVVVSIGLGLLVSALLAGWNRWIVRRPSPAVLGARVRRTSTPVLALLLIVLVVRPYLAFELNVSGAFATIVDGVLTAAVVLSAARLYWLVVTLLADWRRASPRFAVGSLDGDLLRLASRIVGFLGVVGILVYGGNELGLPVLGLLTGLGVGGLAVALAIRPTLENLIGGLILYTDRPVVVGDFCTIGNHTGTVETIGIRSTVIRKIDRTLLSIPNATFADMEIVNWAKCDMMQILSTVGLRYETTTDQLRYVLARMREMFHAHPMIDRETVRVRFAGFGASSLDVQIRVYALTHEWNEFHAVREDVFFRIQKIVSDSGTGFAFPSQTLYMGRDAGLDEERGHEVAGEVQAWRRAGKLPFPEMAASEIDRLAGTLDYPPYGSPGTESVGATESLSVEVEPEELDPELEPVEQRREDA